jgi:fatty-acyl-CoA synthase
MVGFLFNHCTSKDAVGFVGHAGTLVKKITGMRLVKYNVLEDKLVRDEKGLCVECEPNEVGQLVMEIRSNPLSLFRGYTDKKATEKKIATDVIRSGDRYFCSGDLLCQNSQGYYRFVDRIGDTFRWKGQNCSTMEVSEIVSAFPGVIEANVYGVSVPNHMDGRAPCAAISCDSNLDLSDLLGYMKKTLPSYAIPVFIRITPQMNNITETFKHQKVELRNQGIDIHAISDPMYVLFDGNSYVNLDTEVYNQICFGNCKF